MATKLKMVLYRKLNSRQKEAYNFQKVSAALADYGFITIRLSNDWEGADFIAQHKDGKFLKVQLKSRLAFGKKYLGRRLHMCFPHAGCWYLFPHDKVLRKVLRSGPVRRSVSWKSNGGYSFPTVSRALLALLRPYRLATK